MRAHRLDSIATVRSEQPETWRRVRRFNKPVQLAVAAAERALASAKEPADVSLISLAPCHAGSPELFEWVRKFNDRGERRTPFRTNPSHTLHAVDNLALSAVAIWAGSRGQGVGLGGAPGQAWEALEIAIEGGGEILLFAGDQDDSERGGGEIGVALLLAETPPLGRRAIKLRAVERTISDPATPTANSARGIGALVMALEGAAPGPFAYQVPLADGDGIDSITIRAEIG